MWKRWGTVWGFAALAYDAWVAVDWSLPEGVFAALHFGPAEYAGMMTFVTLCAIFFLSPHINALRPGIRLRKLAPDIEAAMQSNVADLVGSRNNGLETPAATSSTRARIIELTHVLDKKGISHPPLTQKDSMTLWYHFLPTLLGAVRAANMKSAKAVWANMERQKRGGGDGALLR